MLIQQYFENSTMALEDKPAVICKERRYSYRELYEWSKVLAEELRACGVEKGDRVGIYLSNKVELIVSIYAVLHCDAVFVCINPQTKAEKLSYMLKDSAAVCLIAEATLKRHFVPAVAAVSTLKQLFTVGEFDNTSVDINARQFPPQSTSEIGWVPMAIDQDLAAIIYTSGSTGDPKGVMLTHLNMITAMNSVSGYLGMMESDTVICALPLSFDYGMYQIFMSFRVGATLVLEESFVFPVKVLEQIERCQVTVFPIVPTMLSMLLAGDLLDKYKLPSVRLMTNTAAALAEHHIAQIREKLPAVTLFSMYGLTECKRVSYLPPEELERRPLSIGKGMPNQEMYLVDEAGNRLPNGSSGQLVVRGSHVMRGYWKKPEQTAKRLHAGENEGEMVLHTGDLFRTDEDGYFYFLGRMDDIIKSRGEKVSPKEVENVLYSHPAVKDVAVIGVPHDTLGESIKAFIVTKSEVTEKDLKKYCMSRLENFMVPETFVLVEDLPKTQTGKIKKTGLS